MYEQHGPHFHSSCRIPHSCHCLNIAASRDFHKSGFPLVDNLNFQDFKN